MTKKLGGCGGLCRIGFRRYFVPHYGRTTLSPIYAAMPRVPQIGATRDSYVYRVRVPAPLKAQWDEHCAKQDKTPSALLRALMRYIVQGDMPPGVRHWVASQIEGAADSGPQEEARSQADAERVRGSCCRRESRRLFAAAVRYQLRSGQLDPPTAVHDGGHPGALGVIAPASGHWPLPESGHPQSHGRPGAAAQAPVEP